MKICFIDLLGLTYDGDTLQKRGLGGSESAVILLSQELAKTGFEVTVYNNCKDSQATPGVYNGVTYIDHTDFDSNSQYDIVVASRSVKPFFAGNQYSGLCLKAKHRVLWMHDTFCDGDQHIEALIQQKYINEIFTLSDFHTNYISNCDHGARRNYEVLKPYIWQTRNGAVQRIDEVDVTQKDRNLFVYNASATKGLIPLLEKIWPEVKRQISGAKLKCIGGYYRFREGAEPDAQEKTVRKLMEDPKLKNLDVEFTGVISQQQIAEILAKANFMLYPTDFPETFGISSLESLLYRTPIITSRFGALEETAIDSACYKIDYSAVPNSLFPNINADNQAKRYIQTVVNAYNNPYLHQQKQYACDVVKDVAGWDTVALQWKQHFYNIFKKPLPVNEYRTVSKINDKVLRIFGRRTVNPETQKTYKSYGKQQRFVIISPFWNAQDYIKNCILSVAQQDYENYKHILIDDNSDDDSLETAHHTIDSLDPEIRDRFVIVKNTENRGAIQNQLAAIEKYTLEDDVIMLLDGDDWLVNNNSLFHFYNDIYQQGYEFTYGSMWSLADNIPLVAQDYPSAIKQNREYRKHRFNWGIPYTHLRTFKKHLVNGININSLKTDDGKWMRAGADNPFFYEVIECADPDKIYCVKEIVCNYNDVNPLNDYKIRAEEQNRNANKNSLRKIPNDITWNIISQDWENGFDDLIKKLSSNRNSVVVQAGGNQGLYPLLLSAYYKKVYTFEPIPSSYSVLSYNCSRKDNIFHYQKGLGSENTKATSHNNQIENSGKYKLSFTENGDIDVITIDSLNLTECDLIWLDTELSEYEVLVGAEQTIQRFKPDIIVEGPETTNYRVNRLLESQGYKEIDRVNNDSVFRHKTNLKSILIAVPTNKYIEPETMKSIYDLKVPAGYTSEFQFFYGYQIDQIRNLIADWAKRYDYLFSVDSDIVLPNDTLEKMLSAEKDIISGLYIQRIPGMHTLEVYEHTPNGGVQNIPYEKIKDRGIVEIASCGFGCCLIKGDVFRKMEYPHFYYKSAINHKDTVSEDVYFCLKAKDLGYRVWADTSIKCEHIGSTHFVVNDRISAQKTEPVPATVKKEPTHLEKISEVDLLPKTHFEYLKTMDIKPKVIYDIGACVGHWWKKAQSVWPEAEFVLFDGADSAKPFLEKSGHRFFHGVLSNERQLVEFYQDPDNPGGNSYYKETTGAFTEKHKTLRDTYVLDDVVHELGLPYPDLVKLDVQGAEIDILLGAQATITNCNDIILEAQHKNYNEGAPKVADVIAFMSKIGFKLVKNFSLSDVDGDYHFTRVR